MSARRPITPDEAERVAVLYGDALRRGHTRMRNLARDVLNRHLATIDTPGARVEYRDFLMAVADGHWETK